MTAPEEKEQAQSRTLWGCLILVLLLFVLLAVMPHPPGSHRKARESTLKANLHQIRNAIDQFKADTGAFPSSLLDLTRDRAEPPVRGVDAQGREVDIAAEAYAGPYLSVTGGIAATGIPVNPFKHPNDTDYADVGAHWAYRNGLLRPAAPAEGETLDGMPYSAL